MASQESLKAALDEARRFIKVGDDYLAALKDAERAATENKRTNPDHKWMHYAAHHPAKSGATKRASMDLTRSLAAYRNPLS